jgi:transcriptional regulator with XRE-family HTH domain
MKTISDQIRSLRKAKGLSQEALAEKAKINLRTLQRIETGNVVPRGETLRLLAQALDVSVEDFSAAIGESPVVLQEDTGFLKLMNLSALTFWIFPFGNVIVPLVLWILKRKTVTGVHDLGKRILNFQITWSLIIYGLTFVSMFSMISGTFFINPFLVVTVIFALAIGNTIYIFSNGRKIVEGDGDLYTTSFRFIQ